MGEDITQDRLDIRSYIDTARKHGGNVMAALRAAFTGDQGQRLDPAGRRTVREVLQAEK